MGTPRPIPTGETDSLGRPVKVSGRVIEQRATAPAPSRSTVYQQAARQVGGGRFTADELLTQFYVSRLIDRAFTDPEPDDGVDWMLKGGMRQLAAARVGRHTTDADLYTDLTLDEALESLERRADSDLADGIEYTVESIRRYDHHPDSALVTFTVTVDGQPAGTVDVDVSTVVRTTCPPRSIDPYNPLHVPLARPAKWRAYHPADQVADKVAATFETVAGRPSRRHRDLVDLAVIAETAGMRAGELRTAVQVECAARGFAAPTGFDVPDRDDWARGAPAAAQTVPEWRHRPFDDMLATAQRFLNPALSGAVPDDARWDRRSQAWVAG